jgi:hypothetical protein
MREIPISASAARFGSSTAGMRGITEIATSAPGYDPIPPGAAARVGA